MLFSCRNPFSRGALAAAAAALLLVGCGGGGGGESTTKSDLLAPSSSLAGICTLEGQKSFIRSYLDEVYLWYDEIVDVDASKYSSVAAYMNALLVRTPDASGAPKDEFSAVLTTEEADGLQAAALPTHLVAASAFPRCDPFGESVPLTKVINSQGGRKVGYVLFNNHREAAQDPLITAFENLKTSAVQDLVLDMRCNPGGFLYVAQTAASMITGSQNTGRVFEQLRFNNKREAESRANVFRFTSTVQVETSRYTRGYPLPQLSLPRVYVLSSKDTCSASESIVNGLRGVDVEVIVVGGGTCGKPYGFQRKDNCGLSFFPIEFQGYNEKGFGDYLSGFAPTCAVADDGQTALGAPEEKLLAAALSHADTGVCPPGTAASASSLPMGVDLRTGGRSSAASPVGGRLVLRPKDQ